jgi:hypothetical protein
MSKRRSPSVPERPLRADRLQGLRPFHRDDEGRPSGEDLSTYHTLADGFAETLVKATYLHEPTSGSPRPPRRHFALHLPFHRRGAAAPDPAPHAQPDVPTGS